MSQQNHHQDGRQKHDTQTRIIKEALEILYRARAEAQKRRRKVGQESVETRITLQSAIINLYQALRPLRNEDAVADYWNEAIPSENWIKESDKQIDVDGDINTPIRIRPKQTEEPYQGLDAIPELENNVERIEKTVETVAGEKTKQFVRHDLPELSVLIEISETLEDAAAKLGFVPDIEDDPGEFEV